MRLSSRILLVILLMLWAPLAESCGSNADDGFVTCSELAAERFRSTAAELSDAPSFSAAEIAPGDPLTLSVPVNEFTQNVSVSIRSVEDPNIAVDVPGRETQGDETVLFPLADTNLPLGVYLLRVVFLIGDIPPSDSGYEASQPGASYVLNATLVPHVLTQCRTDIPAASFTVVGE